MTPLPPPTAPTPRAKVDVVYALTDEIRDAVRIAAAIDRPLLLRGNPGSGKSTLARYVAKTWGWDYEEQVVTSRTAARDLMWSFDAVRRLADAQVARTTETELPLAKYISPRALWKAFVKQGKASAKGGKPGCVVLIDEIDKADPDVPNDLLLPLGEARFTVDETEKEVKRARPVLVMITTNGERDLPLAFLRRCVVLNLPDADEDRLVAIAQAHGLAANLVDTRRYARRFLELREETRERVLSTAEFLDALSAAQQFPDVGWDTIWKVAAQKPELQER